MKKITKALSVAVLGVSLLASCTRNVDGETKETKIPDLTGSWVEVSDAGTIMTADVSGDTIEIYWTYTEDDTKALYWSGSFEAPTSSGTYTWDSVNYHEKTDHALMASGDDTKSFTYAEEQITFDVTALGVTKTVHLEKAE